MSDNANINNANKGESPNNDLKEALVKAKASYTEGPYTFKRKATIMHRHNYSEYRKANMAYISDGKSKIGSAIRSVERMKVNAEELNVYMPMLIGEHPSSPNYNKAIDIHFSNIAVVVPVNGKILDTSFIFNSKQDFDNYLAKLVAILNKFTKKKDEVKPGYEADSELDDIYKEKDNAIVALESTLYRVGRPANVADYILWRYCLVYRDVANDESRMSKSDNIRFYLYDEEAKSRENKLKFELQRNATLKYAELLASPEDLLDTLWALSNIHPIDVKSVSANNPADMMLDKIVKLDPSGFLDIAKSKDLKTRSFIERAVSHSLINRIPNTQVLTDKEGNTIGSTLAEGIVYFKNRELNGEIISRIEKQLKSM